MDYFIVNIISNSQSLFVSNGHKSVCFCSISLKRHLKNAVFFWSFDNFAFKIKFIIRFSSWLDWWYRQTTWSVQCAQNIFNKSASQLLTDSPVCLLWKACNCWGDLSYWDWYCNSRIRNWLCYTLHEPQ